MTEFERAANNILNFYTTRDIHCIMSRLVAAVVEISQTGYFRIADQKTKTQKPHNKTTDYNQCTGAVERHQQISTAKPMAIYTGIC